MKKVLKITAYILGVVILLLAGAMGWAQYRFYHLPEQAVKPLQIEASSDSAVLALGAKIVSQTCIGCHLGDDGALSGHTFMKPEEGFGTLWSANITNQKGKGIGLYSDGELAWLIRSGVNREGRYLGPFMQHPLISNEDLTAIVSFLRSESRLTQPSDAVRPPADYNFMARTLIGFGIFDPIAISDRFIETPNPADQLLYGKYLADVRYKCTDCHSASFETNNLLEPEKSPGYCAGGNPIVDREHTATTPSANITPHKGTGIGGWTYEQFKAAVQEGRRPDQSGLNAAMPRFTLIEEAELAAIWAYLQTVPAIDHNPRAAASKK